MSTNEETLQIENLTKADILELETITKVTRLPAAKGSATGAHHDASMIPIAIAVSGPVLTLVGIILSRKDQSSRKRVKMTRITKDEKTVVEIDEKTSAHDAPKAGVIKAVADALKTDPAKIAEALGVKWPGAQPGS
ncbi:MAG TPA: hypothetical protein VH280_10035 [Verrucomicrobiae bacterium]|nr:hypothetical protein [Verrucomicrobiae bacterium]